MRVIGSETEYDSTDIGELERDKNTNFFSNPTRSFRKVIFFPAPGTRGGFRQSRSYHHVKGLLRSGAGLVFMYTNLIFFHGAMA